MVFGFIEREVTAAGLDDCYGRQEERVAAMTRLCGVRWPEMHQAETNIRRRSWCALLWKSLLRWPFAHYGRSPRWSQGPSLRSCRTPTYFSVVCTEECASESWICS